MKIIYALLGVAGAVLLKSALDRRDEEGASPRLVPADVHAEGVSAEAEVTGPLAEV